MSEAREHPGDCLCGAVRRNEISVCPGSLDDPQAVSPDCHVMTESRVSRARMDDRPPDDPRFRPGAEDRDTDL